jgi:hypothetical protein
MCGEKAEATPNKSWRNKLSRATYRRPNLQKSEEQWINSLKI